MKYTKNASGSGLKVTFCEKQIRKMREMISMNQMEAKPAQTPRNCDWQRDMLCKLSFQANANFGKQSRRIN